MLSGMSEAVSDDDELFLPPSTAATGLVHLHNVPEYQLPAFTSDTEYSYLTNMLTHETHCLENNNRDVLESQQSHFSMVIEQPPSKGRILRQGSIVDGLLHEIYDRWHYGRNDSIDSDTLTECSSTSDIVFHSRHEPGGYHSAMEKQHGSQLNRSFLQNQSFSQLQRMLSDLQRSIAVMNVQLVKQLKRRDRRQAKLQRNCDIVTAVLQAASLKRQIDTRMKFSIQPPPGESAFDQWRDAMKAVCRLPMGMPPEFRKKVWLSLADHYLFQLKINWEQTIRFVFNDRSNPDDEQLGMQIVKDLHRTGCSNFSGDDNEEDRAVLKRLLLAYARWNKRVGYCQGFNVIAALLLNVMDRKEDDALKVMIYLIDSVLPESYFANSLRALSVDMAVFRDLLRLTYPKLSKHLDRLQLAAQDVKTGACYEPPLTNVFTMQWFLTLFATCLPVNIVLRVWDSIFLEGSEVLLRTALTIWGKLAKRIMGATSADEFYTLMGELSSSVMQGSVFDGDVMVKSIYSLGDFPLMHLNELREKYRYNIRPISQPSSNNKKNGKRNVLKSILNSDEDELDDDDIAAMACMPGNVNSSDISVLGPGVYGSEMGENTSKSVPEMERMTTDIQSLKLQYERLRQRQQQAHIIIAAASAKKVRPSSSHEVGTPSIPAAALVPNIESPVAMNHLFLGKGSSSTRNRLVTDGPRICAPSHHGGNNAVLTKQLQAVANAHAVSKSKRMKTSVPKDSTIRRTSLSKAAQSSASETSGCSIQTTSSLAASVQISQVSSTSEVNILSEEINSTEVDNIALQLSNNSPDSNICKADSTQLHQEAIHSHNLQELQLPLFETRSDKPVLINNINLHEIQSKEKVTVNVIENKSENTEKESFMSERKTGENDGFKAIQTECDIQADKTLDTQISHVVQSALCSDGNLSYESHLIERSYNTDAEIGSTIRAMEDSGFESPSAMSPMMLLDAKLCHEEDLCTEIGLTDEVTSAEEKSANKTGLERQDSNSEIKCSSVRCDFINTESQRLGSDSDKTSVYQASSHDNVNGERPEDAAPKMTAKSAAEVAELDSVENDSSGDESCLTPDQEVFVHSSSVIETISIPATLHVTKPNGDQSHTAISCLHRSRKSCSSNGDESEQETNMSQFRSSLNNKTQKHSDINANKSSSQYKRARRFSSPAGPGVICIGSQGDPAYIKASSKPFNPFPVRHFNANRAKTGLKLGLYSESTLEKLRVLKPRTPST